MLKIIEREQTRVPEREIKSEERVRERRRGLEQLLGR